jgi:hypothetical protein
MEEVLLMGKDGNREWPVTLITYDNGKMDLHCQTGLHHVKAITAGRKIMNARGYSVARKHLWIAASGIYYRVTKRRGE